jgi:hypothetical protein
MRVPESNYVEVEVDNSSSHDDFRVTYNVDEDGRQTRNLRANATEEDGLGSGEEDASQQPRQAIEVAQSLNEVFFWTWTQEDDVADATENPETVFRQFAPDEVPGMIFIKELPEGEKVRAKNHKDIFFLIGFWRWGSRRDT